jgi:hypothetical protein
VTLSPTGPRSEHWGGAKKLLKIQLQYSSVLMLLNCSASIVQQQAAAEKKSSFGRQTLLG